MVRICLQIWRMKISNFDRKVCRIRNQSINQRLWSPWSLPSDQNYQKSKKSSQPKDRQSLKLLPVLSSTTAWMISTLATRTTNSTMKKPLMSPRTLKRKRTKCWTCRIRWITSRGRFVHREETWARRIGRGKSKSSKSSTLRLVFPLVTHQSPTKQIDVSRSTINRFVCTFQLRCSILISEPFKSITIVSLFSPNNISRRFSSFCSILHVLPINYASLKSFEVFFALFSPVFQLWEVLAPCSKLCIDLYLIYVRKLVFALRLVKHNICIKAFRSILTNFHDIF